MPSSRPVSVVLALLAVGAASAGASACGDDESDAPVPTPAASTLVAPGGAAPLEPGTNLSTPATSGVPGNTSEELVEITTGGSGGYGDGGDDAGG